MNGGRPPWCAPISNSAAKPFASEPEIQKADSQSQLILEVVAIAGGQGRSGHGQLVQGKEAFGRIKYRIESFLGRLKGS
jgi:hypothetical protein